MDKKNLLSLIFLLAIVPFVQADTLDLAQGHPERYVVKKGDTLWDISARFFRDAWRWPDIWEKNPQIKDPDLIYPGDTVSLVYQDGKPVLRVRRGNRPTVKLSPHVRSSKRDSAISMIPIDTINQFLDESRVVSEGELDTAPYVVSAGKEHLIAGMSSRIYARGLEENTQSEYGVYRKGKPYQNPPGSRQDEALGYEALHVGDAVMQQGGDPATLMVTRAKMEILSGDRLLPLIQDQVREPFVPHEPGKQLDGSIISVINGVTQIGQHQVVVLNLGEQDGIEAGHVLAVFQKGEVIEDRVVLPEQEPPPDTSNIGFAHGVDRDLDLLGRKVAKAFQGQHVETVSMPDERAGMLMVFRTFEKLSYALVMEATRAMHIYDKVVTP